MKRLRALVAVAAMTLTAGACAPAAERVAHAGPTNSETKLMVENNNWLDVAVYLVRGSARTRIGSVTSMGRAEFRIPNAYVMGVSNVTVEANPIGASESYVSPPIEVFPGARVALTVGNSVRLSNYAVYASQ
jgi:hypothetical protein